MFPTTGYKAIQTVDKGLVNRKQFEYFFGERLHLQAVKCNLTELTTRSASLILQASGVARCACGRVPHALAVVCILAYIHTYIHTYMHNLFDKAG